MNREQLLQQHASLRVYQERYDTALQPWGLRADAPTLAQDPLSYRQDNCVRMKRLLPPGHELQQVQYRGLEHNTLDIFEPRLCKACRDVAFDNNTVPYDVPLRRVEAIDNNGAKIVNWIGQRSFIEDFKAPVRRVTSFLTPHGRVNVAGQPIR